MCRLLGSEASDPSEAQLSLEKRRHHLLFRSEVEASITRKLSLKRITKTHPCKGQENHTSAHKGCAAAVARPAPVIGEVSSMSASLAGAVISEKRAEGHRVLHPFQHARVRGEGYDGVGEHAQASLSRGRILPQERVHRSKNLSIQTIRNYDIPILLFVIVVVTV